MYSKRRTTETKMPARAGKTKGPAAANNTSFAIWRVAAGSRQGRRELLIWTFSPAMLLPTTQEAGPRRQPASLLLIVAPFTQTHSPTDGSAQARRPLDCSHGQHARRSPRPREVVATSGNELERTDIRRPYTRRTFHINNGSRINGSVDCRRHLK